MLPANGLYGHIANNAFKSTVLLAGFLVLVAIYWWAGCLIFSAVWSLHTHAQFGLPLWDAFDAIVHSATDLALRRWIVPVVMTLAWFAAAWIFHRHMISAATGSQPIERRAETRLYNLVENLAISAGLPMPRIEIIETPALNAYAAGLTPASSTIAVTRGLLDTLTPQELEAVLAHEMTHIKNHDVQLTVIALIFAGGLALLSDVINNFFQSFDPRWVGSRSPVTLSDRGDNNKDKQGAVLAAVLAIVVGFVVMGLAQLFAVMSQFALSRSREYMADAGAVELTKNPDALISALQRISENDDVPLASEGMRAMMISRHFDPGDYIEKLFSTHPPIDDRVSALEKFAGGRVRGPRSPSRPIRTVVRQPVPGSAPASAPVGSMGIAGARATFGRRG